MSELADRIRGARFTPVHLREGYDMGEVDAFLDRLAAAVDHGESTGPLVQAAAFTPVRLREGYDMGEVDAFLDRVVADQGSAEPTPAGPVEVQNPYSKSAEPTPDVIQEQRGLLSRLFGKG